jgi:RNA polymerase primary sigma factor
MTTATVTASQVRAAQGGDEEALWTVVSEYDAVLMSIVKSVARQATPADVADLHQEARMALIMCLRSYDTDSDASLHTYAYASVRRAVAEEWIRMSTSHTIDPTAVLRVRRALATTEGDIEGAWMLLAMNVDPRKVMSRETFMSVLEAMGEALSLDSPAGRGGSDGAGASQATLADTIPDPIDAESDADRRDAARWLLTQIPSRQAYALRVFYGIGTQQLSDEAAREEMGVKMATLRNLRYEGKVSARRVADVHDLNLGRRYIATSSVTEAA